MRRAPPLTWPLLTVHGFFRHSRRMMSVTPSSEEAFAILDRFTAAFNRQDVTGMDATLHFPHFFPGVPPMSWERAGSLSPGFFPSLVSSGWAYSHYTKKAVLLTGPERVHFLVEYDRCRSDGSVLSKQRAIWIVVCMDGRWGIQVRSNEQIMSDLN